MGWWFSKKSGKRGTGKETGEKETGNGDPAPGFRIETGMGTDTGCVREINEDSGELVWPTEATRLEKRGILAAVADGMGGHEAGEQASRLAVGEIADEYYRRHDDPHVSLRHAFERANRTIRREAARRPEWAGMGTTCTALVLRGGLAYAAHVGDSRCYLLRGGDIYLMTEDHSMVMELVRKGLLTQEEARTHEDRNVILRSLGTQPDVEVALWEEPFPVRVNDRFLICSDGLYDLVRDDELLAVAGTLPPQTACDRLVAMARERGGYDNITVTVLALHSLESNKTDHLAETRESEVLG